MLAKRPGQTYVLLPAELNGGILVVAGLGNRVKRAASRFLPSL